MRDHGLTEGLNSELLENACHVSQTAPSCTGPAHLLHTFLLATHSEDDPWHTSSDILPAGRRHRLFSGSWHIVSILASLQFRRKHRACSDWEPRDGARETPEEPGAWGEPMCIPATAREAP